MRYKKLPGIYSSPIKHTTKKTHFHNKDGSIIKDEKDDRSDYQQWIDYANTLDEIKVDPNKKLPSSSSLEKYHPE